MSERFIPVEAYRSKSKELPEKNKPLLSQVREKLQKYRKQIALAGGLFLLAGEATGVRQQATDAIENTTHTIQHKLENANIVTIAEILGKVSLPIEVPELMTLLREHNETKLKDLHPEFQSKIRQLMAAARERGIEAVVKSGHRSPEEQNELYSLGRTEPGSVVTEVKGGDSWHNYGRSVDLIAVDKDGKRVFGESEERQLKELAQLASSIDPSIVWGGSWKTMKDAYHFEWHPDTTLAEEKMHLTRDVIASR